MRILRNQIEMKVLVNVAEEWKRGRENKHAKSRNETKQQDKDAFAPFGEQL